jgi:hypothetical protein
LLNTDHLTLTLRLAQERKKEKEKIGLTALAGSLTLSLDTSSHWVTDIVSLHWVTQKTGLPATPA